MKKFLSTVIVLCISIGSTVCSASDGRNNLIDEPKDNSHNILNQNYEEREENNNQDILGEEEDGPGYYIIKEREDGSIECIWVSGNFLDKDE